jgi:hypothetical protein
MQADEKGYVRVCIAPRLTPSEANKFTMFQDTWVPNGQSKPKIDGADVPRRVVPTAPEGKSFDDGDDLEVPF